MKLKKLLKEIKGIEVKGSRDVEITGLCSNSAVVAPGNLFIARKGRQVDGAQYIPEAVAAGAAAVLTDMYDPSMRGVVQLIHPDPGSLEAQFGLAYYQNPSAELLMVGITGTNGKTTTASLLRQLLEGLGKPTGLIGTVEYVLGSQSCAATRTTPDVVSNHKMLREMVRQGCRAAVMEVTSHGLDQGRVDGIDYDVAVFTNLTQDHLDYHGTMEHYAAAKQRLFLGLSADGCAVVNRDDPWTEAVLKGCRAQVLTYGLTTDADVYVSDVNAGLDGTTATIHYGRESMAARWQLQGTFNIYNVLAAVSVALAEGWALEEVCTVLPQLQPARGRMEKVVSDGQVSVFVDFAHTPDALEKALEAMRPMARGRLITVVGCGGDRDKEKRPMMGEVASRLSDLLIVTSDNPRTEDPEEICRQVVSGAGDDCLVEVDRHRAIKRAIEEAQEGDVILIAGKGHETTQIFARHTIDFDDRLVAVDCFHQLRQLHEMR